MHPAKATAVTATMATLNLKTPRRISSDEASGGQKTGHTS
jgi:hypothetical protein